MNRTYSILSLVLFIVLSGLDLFAIWKGMEGVHEIVKPLLLLVLLVYFLKSKSVRTFSTTIMVLALIFSWAGDVFLLFENEASSMFLFGLVSFLIAHICYIVVFQRLSEKTRPSPLRFPLAALLVIFCSLLVFLLWPGLGNMEIPVILYASVITVMGISAVFRQGPGSGLVLVGALFFVASDSILAYNKFFAVVEFGGLYTMSTYLVAQLLIVQGILNFLNQQKN